MMNTNTSCYALQSLFRVIDSVNDSVCLGPYLLAKLELLDAAQGRSIGKQVQFPREILRKFAEIHADLVHYPQVRYP